MSKSEEIGRDHGLQRKHVIYAPCLRISPRVPHRSGRDTLASSGSCHRTKAAASSPDRSSRSAFEAKVSKNREAAFSRHATSICASTE